VTENYSKSARLAKEFLDAAFKWLEPSFRMNSIDAYNNYQVAKIKLFQNYESNPFGPAKNKVLKEFMEEKVCFGSLSLFFIALMSLTFKRIVKFLFN